MHGLQLQSTSKLPEYCMDATPAMQNDAHMCRPVGRRLTGRFGWLYLCRLHAFVGVVDSWQAAGEKS